MNRRGFLKSCGMAVAGLAGSGGTNPANLEMVEHTAYYDSKTGQKLAKPYTYMMSSDIISL